MDVWVLAILVLAAYLIGALPSGMVIGALHGVDFDGRLYGATQPDFQRLDLSLRYRLRLSDRYSATLSGEVYNVTREVNFASVGGNIFGTSGFLIPNQTYEPSGRQYQLGVRFAL